MKTRNAHRNGPASRGAVAARAIAVAVLALCLGGGAVAESAAGPLVNVNTATHEELQALPGVGAARAAAIVEARKERGGFKSLDDLLDVKGIGPAGLERLRPHARLAGPTRVGGATDH